MISWPNGMVEESLFLGLPEGNSLPQGSHRCRILMTLGWLNTCVASSCSNLRPQMIFFHFLPMYIWLDYLFIFFKYLIWFLFPGMVWLGFPWAQSSWTSLLLIMPYPQKDNIFFPIFLSLGHWCHPIFICGLRAHEGHCLTGSTNTLVMVQVMSPCQRHSFSHFSTKLSDHCYWCTDCYKWPCSSK